MIEALPGEITVDDIMAELYFKQQMDAGLKELDEGNTYFNSPGAARYLTRPHRKGRKERKVPSAAIVMGWDFFI